MSVDRKGFDVNEALDYLAIELFRTFARFEYALKAAGFHCGDGRAKPNWQAFAESESVRNTFDNPTNDDLEVANTSVPTRRRAKKFEMES